MRRRNTTSMARTLGDEDVVTSADVPAEPSEEAVGETTEADYSFDGYSVEFLDKVALMPIATPVSANR